MKKLFFAFLVAVMLTMLPLPKASLASPNFATYSNGPIVTHPGGGSGGANASALQTALGMGTFGFGAQQVNGNSVADDFVVTDPTGWTVNTMSFYTYQTGSGTTSTITGLYFQIWNGDPSSGTAAIVFGDLTTNRLGTGTWSNTYRTLDTDVATATTRPIMLVTGTVGALLPAGTYWVEVQFAGSLGSGPWAPPITILGQTATGNGKQNVAGTWGNMTDVGQQGLPFEIDYTVFDPATPTPTTCPISVSAPTLGTPAHRSHTTDTTPSFTWSQVSGAQSYRLMVYNEDRSFEYKKRRVGETSTSYTLQAAEALTPQKYLWRVRTQDTLCSTWTGWSQRNTLFVD